MTTNIDHPSADGATPRRRRDRTHWLYLAVIAAVLGGVALGLIAPSAGKEVGVLGTTFVSLIKMMIAPVIFCTIVLGIGSVRKAATVGKVGGVAFIYFLVMSTMALGIGLVVGNLLRPGSGMHLASSAVRGHAFSYRIVRRLVVPWIVSIPGTRDEVEIARNQLQINVAHRHLMWAASDPRAGATSSGG